MAKKLKKAKKPMNPRTRNVLINSFKGIISNQSCIDNGKEAPWWLAILFLLFSILIPLIPNHVQLSNDYGSKFLINGSFGMDIGLARASAQFKKDGKTLNVEGGELTYSGAERDTTPIYTNVDSTTGQYTFVMYFTETTGGIYNAFKSSVAKLEYTCGTTDIYNKESEEDVAKGAYKPSYMILSTKTLYAALYKLDTTKKYSESYSGLNWSHTRGDLVAKAVENFVDNDGNAITDFTSFNLATISKENVASALKVWKKVINQTYEEAKTRVKWTNTLIYLGVYAGLVVFLGLMVFLLTRGKNNPFNSLNFWVCQKIAYFLGFTPAVLALILGFIFSGNMIGQMAFIMLLSLRTMWASMRQLRPVYNQ